ncbi:MULTISPECIES: hypothetical protein [unclassified Breznakia]|uniref:hypothetical protein n=1 Tax=unclassified Breznakia TaxID=2623764 RepID=UPI0024747D71|nr:MULTISPECIES: hypothetical protein [unclassified Breznakia]MDH6367599.1 hypothetical protein [Breznakia sp. PH1-1]MDH6404719.1 hypothetical protein [Breznakia sp. PF1-11]MDH6412429.1 hypothetical protein [Breznakia sp. PFB1-11]MDH6414794.1 hypothetical protein [Breznakia sp. PFB1-14]MDH6417100.1 hypothetical protein [Breznakia sp. PFB1-4]
MLGMVITNIAYWTIAFVIYGIRLSSKKALIFGDYTFYYKLDDEKKEKYMDESRILVKKALIALGIVLNFPFVINAYITNDTIGLVLLIASYLLYVTWYLHEDRKLKQRFTKESSR